MKLGNRIISIAVLVVVLVVGLGSRPLYTVLRMMYHTYLEITEEAGTSSETPLEMVSATYDAGIFKQTWWIEFNGAVRRWIGSRELNGSSVIRVTDNGYVAGTYASTSTDYEYEETVRLKEYLDSRGIDLLYVNEPLKYLDDSEMLEQFGLESYGNRNADLYLERIGEAGVECLDLRTDIAAEYGDAWELFYRTDHHWTVPAGLWATRKIADVLNSDYGYRIDSSLYDEDNLEYTYFKDCWLGEQGRKVAASYIGLDDFTEIKPSYETDITWRYWDEEPTEGTFDSLIDEECYNSGEDVYASDLWHYSYCPRQINGLSLVNNNVPDGKILYLGDSYDQVVVPFLALGVHEVDTLVLRSYEGSLLDYIEAGDYDTVIIAYAEFMIGAHDDDSSANYGMFGFE